MSVRHIHTQAQAQAELERVRAANRANYARRKERILNGTQGQAQAELERQRATQRANYAQRKERMLNNAEYREQELQRWKIKRDQKRKEIEEDPFMSMQERMLIEWPKLEEWLERHRRSENIQEREDMIEKVRQRYYSYNFSDLICLESRN